MVKFVFLELFFNKDVNKKSGSEIIKILLYATLK